MDGRANAAPSRCSATVAATCTTARNRGARASTSSASTCGQPRPVSRMSAARAEGELPQRWPRLDLAAHLRAGADVAREEPVGQGPTMAATTTGRSSPAGSFTGPPRAVRAW